MCKCAPFYLFNCIISVNRFSVNQKDLCKLNKFIIQQLNDIANLICLVKGRLALLKNCNFLAILQ